MRPLALSAVMLSAVTAACATGGVDQDVIDLARRTRTGGAFHIEFDARGRFVEAGAETLLEQVPAHCVAAVDAAFPGGTITGAERVRVPGRTDWMVAKTIDGRHLEILVADDGVVRGGEEALTPGEWPEEVVRAARAAVPGGTLQVVERVWGDEAVGAESFHVKFDVGGDSLRVGVTEGAEIVRVVRRLAGQTRVPR